MKTYLIKYIFFKMIKSKKISAISVDDAEREIISQGINKKYILSATIVK